MKCFLFVVMTAALVAASPASAADKTHQQLMAEIRMLQEQQAQLQQMLRGLSDTLKTMTSKIEEQTGATRKGFADQKLVAENIAEGVRILREKADDTNVRLSTMSQEMESMRSAIQSMPAPGAVPPVGAPGDPSVPGGPPAATPTPTGPPPNVSPNKAWDAAFNDYASGQYDLAIAGFEFYIKSFPTGPRVDDAQLNIGNSHYAMGKYREAAAAFQKVISDYPKTDSVPPAYYKLGLSYEGLKELALARRASETLLKEFSGTSVQDAQLAKQRLDSLNKKE
jgi:TolA-binding protein